MGRCMGPPRVRKQFFACDLDPFNERNKPFPVIFLHQLQNPWLIVQLPYVYNSVRMCTTASIHVQQHPYMYNSVHAFIMTTMCFWLWISKGCFVDLGNVFQLTIKTNQRLNWIIISEYYVPTMYIFMIYALIFIAGVLLLCSSLKTQL